MLRLTLCIATQSLVILGRYFLDITNYAQIVEDMHHEDIEGGNKRSCQQVSYSGSNNDL